MDASRGSRCSLLCYVWQNPVNNSSRSIVTVTRTGSSTWPSSTGLCAGSCLGCQVGCLLYSEACTAIPGRWVGIIISNSRIQYFYLSADINFPSTPFDSQVNSTQIRTGLHLDVPTSFSGDDHRVSSLQSRQSSLPGSYQTTVGFYCPTPSPLCLSLEARRSKCKESLRLGLVR